MKRIFFFVVILLGAKFAQGQAYQDRFDAALSSGDLKAQRQVLADWMADAPQDVDCYIARYNYYVNLVGEMASVNPASLDAEMRQSVDSGLAIIDEAIELYPNRLDLRFGKIYFLGVVQMWDTFADEIIRCLDHSEKVNHVWQFPNIEEGMADLITESMLDYQSSMFNAVENWKQPSAADSAMLMRIRRVAKRSVQLFPKDIYEVNILATTYTFFQEYESAIKYLQRAERIDPNDITVLRNMRDVYEKMGKGKLAKQYEERINQLKK